MKRTAAIFLLTLPFVANAQQKEEAEYPKAFITKIAGTSIDVFAPDYVMQPGQRFEARYIFDVARNACLKQGVATKLTSHEPALFAMRDNRTTLKGSLFKYRCSR